MRPQRQTLRLPPRARGRSWKYAVIGPLALIVGGPIVLAYRLFIGWWLNPILNMQLERKLREQVRTDLWFLFDNFNGRFVPNERRDKYATLVKVEAAELRVVISKHHGDYGISVARRDNPEIRENLESVLEAIYEREGARHRPQYINLAELGELFRKKFTEVQMALSKENYPDTAAAIDRNHQLGMQRMARDFNRSNGSFDADLVNPNDLMKKVPK